MEVSYTIAGDAAAAGRIRAAGPAITRAAVAAVTRLTLELESYVKSQKLSGQALHVRSGNLRNSVNSQFDGDGSGGARFTGRVGTGIVYARIHEYGGTIARHMEPGVVRLRTAAGGELLRQASHKNLAIFAKASHKRFREVQHGGADWVIHMPERSFLRSSLREQAEHIKASIAAAARGALK